MWAETQQDGDLRVLYTNHAPQEFGIGIVVAFDSSRQNSIADLLVHGSADVALQAPSASHGPIGLTLLAAYILRVA